MKTYAVEISISDGALQMFRVGNIAFLNASLQTNKDISWGDIVVSSLPSELCTNGYFLEVSSEMVYCRLIKIK